MLLDPRNGPDFDLPPCDLPRRAWVVASLPRTGSTLLCRALWDTGRVGAPKEYLNPMQVRDWEVRLGTRVGSRLHRVVRGPALALVGRWGWTDARLRDHLDRVRARRTGPDGHFGVKIHHHHLARWFLDAGRDPQAWLEHPTWVLLTRQDRVAQAVSWARAVQTGQWASTQQPWMRPVYDRRHIERRLRSIEQGERAWTTWFEQVGVEPLRLHYEEITVDLPGSARRVLVHLGVRDAAQVPIEVPSLRRQADEVSEVWCRRFREETGRW
jgi:LPS sulfotransferase NodH